jgi:hypothetical protein
MLYLVYLSYLATRCAECGQSTEVYNILSHSIDQYQPCLVQLHLSTNLVFLDCPIYTEISEPFACMKYSLFQLTSFL